MEHEAETLRRLLNEQSDESVSDHNMDELIDQIDEPDPAQYIGEIDHTQTLSRTSVNPLQLLSDTPQFIALGQLHNPRVDATEVLGNLMDLFCTTQAEAITRAVNEVYKISESFRSQTSEDIKKMRADIIKQNNVINQHSDTLFEQKKIHKEEVDFLRQQNDDIKAIDAHNVKQYNKMVDMYNDLTSKMKPLVKQNLAMKEQIEGFFENRR